VSVAVSVCRRVLGKKAYLNYCSQRQAEESELDQVEQELSSSNQRRKQAQPGQ